MRVIELFSGTESFSKVARERGHKTFTVDIEKQFNPNRGKVLRAVVPRELCLEIIKHIEAEE